MTLYATRVADECYEIDFRDVIAGHQHIARGTLFAARCIAALHGASLLIDGEAWDKTDMRDVLPVALALAESLGVERRRRRASVTSRKAAGGK